MAKRRTYEQKLYDDLQKLPAQKWFRIDNRDDADKITESVKAFIDFGYAFEFSENYKMIRRLLTEPPVIQAYHLRKELPAGVRVETINRGDTETFITNKGLEYTHTFERTNYRVYFEDKLIATY